jgi:hypothetical protein
MPTHPLYLRSIVIFSSHLHAALWSGLFRFLTKILCAFLLFCAAYMPHPSHPDLIALIIFDEEYNQ